VQWITDAHGNHTRGFRGERGAHQGAHVARLFDIDQHQHQTLAFERSGSQLLQRARSRQGTEPKQLCAVAAFTELGQHRIRHGEYFAFRALEVAQERPHSLIVLP
jgi:hypothetical protein